MASFCFRRQQSGRRPARQPSTVLLGAPPLSISVDSKDLLPDVAMMNLSGTPCFESLCMSLSPNGVYRPRRTLHSTARRLQSFASLLYSKLAFSTLRSIFLSRFIVIFLWNGVFLSASYPPDPGHCSQTVRKTLSRGLLDMSLLFTRFSATNRSFFYCLSLSKFANPLQKYPDKWAFSPLLVQNIRLVRSGYFLSGYLSGFFFYLDSYGIDIRFTSA